MFEGLSLLFTQLMEYRDLYLDRLERQEQEEQTEPNNNSFNNENNEFSADVSMDTSFQKV